MFTDHIDLLLTLNLECNMKLKALESFLQQVETFSNPKVHLEQYQTSAHLGARILHVASSRFGAVHGKSVLDLGCGSGVFTIGSLLMGAGYVLGVDIDADALDICKTNLGDIFDDEESSRCDLIQADVTNGMSMERFRKSFDTVITNPPFGTKNNKGIDVTFLKTALDIATENVFSLHKSSTRNYLEQKCLEWDIEMEVVSRLKFDLPASYNFHRKDTKDIDVDFIRFSFPVFAK